MFGPMKSWSQRLLEFAMTLVAVGLLLNWAWQLLRPLVPVLVVGGGVGVLVGLVVRRMRGW